MIVFLVLFMLAFSLCPTPLSPGNDHKAQASARTSGRLGDLASQSRKGIYFKWLVANRLGKLAYQILLHRESGRPRSVFAPLLGADWEPSKELRQYLETGLHGSFADFPNTSRLSGISRHLWI